MVALAAYNRNIYSNLGGTIFVNLSPSFEAFELFYSPLSHKPVHDRLRSPTPRTTSDAASESPSTTPSRHWTQLDTQPSYLAYPLTRKIIPTPRRHRQHAEKGKEKAPPVQAVDMIQQPTHEVSTPPPMDTDTEEDTIPTQARALSALSLPKRIQPAINTLI
ncbi:hypothetical protein EV426DRAFT_709403 [Tirmania nivea]|nr:hypothetical protein EV426DRAFT_709403 [Tirmania nivea]